MKYIMILIALSLTACAQTNELDSLAADMRAQEHYEQVVRGCEVAGLPVYIKRTGTKIRKKLTRHDMLMASCVRID